MLIMKVQRSEVGMRLIVLLILFAAFGFASSDLCEAHHPISRIVFSLSSRLPGVIGGDKNLLYSPFSISVALAMIYMGAQGGTKTEMCSALDYTLAGDRCLDIDISEGFREVIQSLGNRSEAFSASVANSVFVQLGYTVSPNYITKLRHYFNTEIQYTDFNKEETLTMKTINEWVSNQTNGQISKILNDPLDPMTIMVLMNVVYFKGAWKHPFEASRTRISRFFKTDGSPVEVPFMFIQSEFYFLFDAATNTSYLEMSYVGDMVSMLLVLPNKIHTMPSMAEISQILCGIKPRMEMRTVQVAIPKFKLEYKRELSRDMMALGMRELFSDRADLSGIRDQNDLHVSLMVHKSVIDVDEKGSEASAVSGVGIYGRVNNKPQTFWANHPFLFYIIDKRMETVLFAGRVSEP